MKLTHLSILALISVIVAMVITSQGAQPVPAIVAGQFTGPNTGTTCTTTDYADTDMVVSLTTTGNPIALAFNAGVSLGTNQGIALRPTIDGAAPDITSSVHFVGSGDLTTLGFSRIYTLAKGTHIFKVQSMCQGNVGIGLRWLTVYELR